MPADNTLVGVVVPATVVEIAVREGNERDAQAKRRHAPNTHVKEFVETLLSQYPLVKPAPEQTPESAPPPALATVEDAAQIIIDCLDPEHKRLIYDLAKETQRPLAAYVMSPILMAKENGQVGVVIGEWADKRPTETKAPMPNESTCEYCGQSFKPLREGQRFCPPPPDESDSCGRKWNFDRMRERQKHVPPSPFAPKSSIRVREHQAMMDRLNAQGVALSSDASR